MRTDAIPPQRPSRILTAEYSAAGEFRAPAVGSFNPPPLMLPAHCSVRIFTPTSCDSEVTAEIWLPDAAGWNGNLLATGNGGYSGALSYRQMAEALQRGFAVGGSDTGHAGDELSFGTDHPEKIRDWAYRSTHVLAEDAKAVIAAYYGKSPAHAYFAGCSAGGNRLSARRSAIRGTLTASWRAILEMTASFSTQTSWRAGL